MDFALELNIPALKKPITYKDNILLIGSCFTEHISDRLQHHKFHVLSNPNGILFNPLSVAQSLDSYIQGRSYRAEELFLLHELWNSWDHHTRFSDVDPAAALQKINESQTAAAQFVAKADWVMITLGSAFQYYLKEGAVPVANNHRAPGQWFEKRLLEIDTIVAALSATIADLHLHNPKTQVLFTISPVRHIRDGVIDNNRSKARLIEAVHQLCGRFEQAHYFPAYELVIDILRDYRFYDVDFVHPNYMATSFVWEQFTRSCIGKESQQLMQEVLDIATARSHRPRFPQTQAHRDFCDRYAAKTKELLGKYPYLDLQAELDYFSKEA
jgi:hypothetical protein